MKKSEAIARAHKMHAEAIASEAAKNYHPEIFNAAVEALEYRHQRALEAIRNSKKLED